LYWGSSFRIDNDETILQRRELERGVSFAGRDLIQTSVYVKILVLNEKYHLDHFNHCKKAPGTNISKR